MGKGQDFERMFCRRLSRWWTAGERDDIFWRSPASGAVATIRGKAKKSVTENIVGDIMAVDSIGKPLMDLAFFELKKGYGYIRLWDFFQLQNSNIYKWLSDCNIKRVEYGLEFFLVVSHYTQKLMFISDGIGQKISKFANVDVSSITLKSPLLGSFWVIPYEEFFRVISAEKFMELMSDD